MGRRGGPVLPYRPVAGVIPCGPGWLVCGGRLQGINLFPQDPELLIGFETVLDYRPAFEIIALGAPIGLDETFRQGGRTCDRQARELVGRRRAGAILTPPSREMVRAWRTARGLSGGPATAREASRSRSGRAMAGGPQGSGSIGKVDGELADALAGLGAAGRALLPRVSEIDESIAPYWQRTVFEVRPELTFLQLNDDMPLTYSKHMIAGTEEREALLRARFPGIEQVLDAKVRGVRHHHLVDGAAALWAARRIAARAVSRVPQDPEWDETGLRTEIVR